MKKIKQLGISTNKMSFIYIVAISFIYAIVSLINFANLTFDLERLINWSFWTMYFITIGLALLIMILSISFKKNKARNENKIVDEEECVYACSRTLSSNGNYSKTIVLVKEENRRRKLEKYKKYLQVQRNKAKTEENKKHFINLLNEIDEEYLTKQLEEAVTIKDKKEITQLINEIPNKIDSIQIKYQEVKINSLFNTYYNKNSDELETEYSGSEGFWQRTLPAIAIGLIVVMVIMTAIPSILEDTTLNAIIQLVTRLGVMTLYLVKGLEFADYSILSVYFGILKNRKRLMTDFIQKIYPDMVIEINENKGYKYLVEVKEQPKEETQQAEKE